MPPRRPKRRSAAASARARGARCSSKRRAMTTPSPASSSSRAGWLTGSSSSVSVPIPRRRPLGRASPRSTHPAISRRSSPRCALSRPQSKGARRFALRSACRAPLGPSPCPSDPPPLPTSDLPPQTSSSSARSRGLSRAVASTPSPGAPRERRLRAVPAALVDGYRGSRPEAPAVVYVPHADLSSVAAVALGAAGAGYRLRGITYQRDALATAVAGGSGAAAICDFDRDVPLLRDHGVADAVAIEDAMRAGVRDAISARGEPVATDRAGVAALESLAARKLLASLTLSRSGGVSELEVFLDHFRSALADARRSGIVTVSLDGPSAEHAPDTTLYTLASPAETTPLDDRLEWGVWGLLSSSREIDTRTLVRRAYGLFRDIETPDREMVERSIAAYGRQGDDGRWRLREEDGLGGRQADQTLLATQLVDAGHRLGFKVHVGRDLERRPLPATHAERGAVLADLMTEAERAIPVSRVSRVSTDAVDYVDCVWYDRSRMVFVWQLEWTARMHRSLVALGEAIPDEDRVFRFLAIADERRPLAEFKLRRSPALADLVRRRGWRFVKLAPLRRWATKPDVALDLLEPVLGLSPEVEQMGHQLAFNF